MQLVQPHADYCCGCGRVYDRPGHVAVFGDFSINTTEGDYRYKGNPIRWTKQEAEALFLIFTRKRVSDEALVMQICPDSITGTGHVNVLLSRIRAKLRTMGEPIMFRKVHGWGFELIQPEAQLAA
jgi:DNA-binding response OmpR family regulator